MRFYVYYYFTLISDWTDTELLLLPSINDFVYFEVLRGALEDDLSKLLNIFPFIIPFSYLHF